MSIKNRQTSSTEKSIGNSNINTFLSSVAVILSAIALGGVGIALTQIFQLQQSFRELEASVQKSLATSESQQISSSPSIPVTEPNQQANTEIQPGQFVQYAFKDAAQVEILSVKRIQNPESKTRDIVNINMRFRRLKEGRGHNIISLDQTKARNPETNETYESYNNIISDLERERARKEGRKTDHSKRKHSSGSILMTLVKPGASVDGYVWMSIPEGIKTIDLIVPKTAMFLNVPISE
ncbi:MAG: hypothetical protein MUD14_29400 [Hydrococcus sp. Prado102]|jgi:hypothetical protein|nr:hypothetical protein [Hydrococcus sp. Prado102]